MIDFTKNLNSTLIIKNMHCLRPDLYGLPIEVYSEQFLPYMECRLLGLTMLNCWDPTKELTRWSYQRVDLRARCRFQRSKKIRRALRAIKSRPGFQKGHMNTMTFCENDLDAKASCHEWNIFPQTPHQNQICCGTWENDVEKRMLNENFIAHITTVPLQQCFEGELYNSMYKVLIEEHADQSLLLKCYLMYDEYSGLNEHQSKVSYREVTMKEVEEKSKLKF